MRPRAGRRERAQLQLGRRELLLQARDFARVGRPVDRLLQSRLLLLEVVFLVLDLPQAGARDCGGVLRTLDGEARGDPARDRQPDQEHNRPPEAFLVPIVAQRMEAPLVLLSGRELRESSPESGLRASALHRAFVQSEELDATPFYFECAPGALRLFGPEPRFFRLVAAAKLVDATLLGRPSSLRRVTPLLLLPDVRLSQKLLD